MKKIVFSALLGISTLAFASNAKTFEKENLNSNVVKFDKNEVNSVFIKIDKKTDPSAIKEILKSKKRYVVTACDDSGCFSFGFNGPSDVLYDWILWWLQQP